jgi:hypothetical protein
MYILLDAPLPVVIPPIIDTTDLDNLSLRYGNYLCKFNFIIFKFVYVFLCICILIYMYIYIFHVRKPFDSFKTMVLDLCKCIYIYIYMYVYIYIYMYIRVACTVSTDPKLSDLKKEHTEVRKLEVKQVSIYTCICLCV